MTAPAPDTAHVSGPGKLGETATPVTQEAPSLAQPIVEIAPQPTPDTAGFLLIAGLSGLAHALVMIGVGLSLEPTLVGYGGKDPQSLEIGLWVDDAGDSTSPKVRAQTTPSSIRTSDTEGSQGEKEASAAAALTTSTTNAEPLPAPQADTVQPDTPMPQTSEVALSQLPVPPAPNDTQKDPPPSPNTFTAMNEFRPSLANTMPSEGSVAPGGVTARGSAQTEETTAAPTAAMAGAATAYTRHVIEALSRNRPEDIPSGPPGLVDFKLTIDSSGRVLDYAQLKSSGNRQLDKLARQTVLGIKFPPFEPGDEAKSRSFTTCYDFIIPDPARRKKRVACGQ